ncbi:hypothetical protein Aple_010600 [Acrocarpospora pleiomorpha]|uniref:Uncharacterized protein n=1 Tax=Acrocarpospora pleiomorpha TaxID=90975 RepID=A0A5M3X8X3_9ACTN|nr:hypothetical protein [Acrocarpospora pleiomorpha]GES18165.1 hypothetical protein Aple_010600 [Acrocarpospora pleiomorpha]
MTLRVSSLSRIDIKSFIKGADGTETVEWAFLTDLDAEPAEEDWTAGAWDAPTAKGAPARIKIGPDTTAELTNGTYGAWVRVTSTQSQPVFGPLLLDIL